MRKTRYLYGKLLTLAARRWRLSLLCLLGFVVGLALILILFAIQRRISLGVAGARITARSASIYLNQDVPADKIYALLDGREDLNGYVLHINARSGASPEEEIIIDAVWGAMGEPRTRQTVMAGYYEGDDGDFFLYRAFNFVSADFIGAADTITIDGTPFTSRGVQNGVYPLRENRVTPSAHPLTVDRPGAERVFDESFVDWPDYVIVTAACAAKHAYPVAGIMVFYEDPDSKPMFRSLLAELAELGPVVREYDMPWAESDTAPALTEFNIGLIAQLPGVLIALVSALLLIYFWLGSFRFALRVWQRTGAGRGSCRRALFLLGMTLLLAAAVLGYGVYRLVLPWGKRMGMMLPLPGSVVAVLAILCAALCILCVWLHCRRAARISLAKGGLRA